MAKKKNTKKQKAGKKAKKRAASKKASAPILVISGEARLSHQIIMQSSRDAANDRGPDLEVARDFYLPSGTYLLEAILQAAYERLQDAQAREQKQKQEQEQTSGVPSAGSSAYVVSGPRARYAASSTYPTALAELILSLPSHTLIIRPAQHKGEGGGGMGAHRLANFATGEPLTHENNRQEHDHGTIPEGNRKAIVHVLAIDFERFGKDSDDFTRVFAGKTDFNSLLEKGRAAVVIKCRTMGDVTKSENESTIRQNLNTFLDSDHVAENAILVISADELRRADMPLSHQISWERTIQSTLDELRKLKQDPPPPDKKGYAFLTKPAHLVITFGCDGALYLNQTQIDNPQTDSGFKHAYCVIDPARIEGDFVRGGKGSGRMLGFDSVITAALAHSLMQLLLETLIRPPIEHLQLAINRGLSRGLLAARFLQNYGFVSLHKELGKGAAPVPAPSSEQLESEQYKFSREWLNDVASRYCQWHAQSDITTQAYNRAVIVPFELLGSLIAEGNVHWSTWYVKNPQPAHREKIRAYQARIQESFEEAQSIHCQYLNETDIKRVLGDLHPPAGQRPAYELPYFDRKWWSFLESFILPRELRAISNDSGAATAEASTTFKEKVAKALAHKILKYDLRWITHHAYGHNASNEEFLRHVMGELDIDGEKLSKTITTRLKSMFQDPPTWYVQPVSGEQIDDEPFATWLKALQEKRQTTPEAPTLLGVIPHTSVAQLRSISRRETENYRNIFTIMREYIAVKGAQPPLNIGVFGAAGSGKTFAVTEIANQARDTMSRDCAWKSVRCMSFNLSQFKGPELLTDAFEEIQDVGLQGILPLVFWDEYDSALKGNPLAWLSFFLGPMNDGTYFQRERTRTLPTAIFVFAGSMLTSYLSMHLLHGAVVDPAAVFYAANNVRANKQLDVEGLKANLHRIAKVDQFSPEEWRKAKGPDFKSRLAGVLDVLSVNAAEPVSVEFETARTGGPGNRILISIPVLPAYDYGHYIRRAIILRRVMKDRHPHVFDGNDVLRITSRVARAFIETRSYVHGARSIKRIVEMSSVGGKPTFDPTCVPPASQLTVHVDASEFERILGRGD